MAVGDTVPMEPEAHRLDREAMLAEHIAVAARLDREVNEMVEVGEKEASRLASDLLIERLRNDLGAQFAQAARAVPPPAAAAGPTTTPAIVEAERLALAEAEERRNTTGALRRGRSSPRPCESRHE